MRSLAGFSFALLVATGCATAPEDPFSDGAGGSASIDGSPSPVGAGGALTHGHAGSAGKGGSRTPNPTGTGGAHSAQGGSGTEPWPSGGGASGASGHGGSSSAGTTGAAGKAPTPNPAGGSTGTAGSTGKAGSPGAGGSAPSNGVCSFVSGWSCDPRSKSPCGAAGTACDFSDTGFDCYDPPNDLSLGSPCSDQGPDFCAAGSTCSNGACARFCCFDGDCGGAACVATPHAGGVIGVCSGAPSGTGGSGPGTGGSGPGTGGSDPGTGGSGTAGSGAGGSGPTGDCYSESYGTGSLADLKQSYSPGKWLSTSLEALNRRFPSGHDLLVQMQSDPQLPEFATTDSFAALMESTDTICHEETHGWDFDHSQAGSHAYRLRSDLVISIPELDFFPRSELLPYIKDSSTSLYDSTYLTGEQGTYDFIFLGDELNAYITGLACATTVGDAIDTFGTSLRDGAASHLLYLEWYLNRARTAHPALYAQMKGNADIVKMVRFQWARGHFWTAVAQAYPTLGIDDVAIWAHVNEPANLAEIQLFTGDAPDVVACHP